MRIIEVTELSMLTAFAEIAGCYLPYLRLKRDASAWLLVPAAATLAAFVWLLTLHPHSAGRVYAAYGGIHIGMALAWLWGVDGIRPARTDLLGAGVCLLGACIIVVGPRAD